MQPTLLKLDSKPISDEEKAFGIVHIKKSTGMFLRNWLTYKMREQVLDFERRAFYSPKVASIKLFKAEFNQSMAYDMKRLMMRYNNVGKLSRFDEIVAYEGILCKKIQGGNYRVNEIFS